MEDNLIHPLSEKKGSKSKGKLFYVTVFTLIVLAGIGLGFLANQMRSTSTKRGMSIITRKGGGVTKAGIKDNKSFKDKAVGILKEGGIDGEGSFHLSRPGGKSQNVYLTSSTVDLSQFLNKKVEVWGKTYSSKKAGWLMDVGYIETQ